MIRPKTLISVLAGLTLSASCAFAASISGAGATFPYPVYSKWAGAYQKVSGTAVNYQSIGSGGGITQIKQKTVAFGATDMPLKPADLAALGLIQFPTVIGGIVPLVNIPGIAPGQLVLDGPTLADIYLGKIKTWSDPRIAKLNPGIKLPSLAIAIVHRSDGSGTTFIFSTYLSRASRDWAGSVGANSALDWPLGIGAKGNEGVAANVNRFSGAIGYVEYAYAKQSHLTFTRLINKSGQAVAPTAETFRAAAANTDWAMASRQSFYVLLVDQPGATSWPITATTYILVYKQPVDPKATVEALRFFKWAYADGGALAMGLDYVPLPDNAVKAVEASWKQVRGSGM